MSKNAPLLLKAGLFLVLLSFVILVGSEIRSIGNRAATRKLTEQIRSGFGERTQGDPDGYSDLQMPVLQLEGEDFSGLIEIPAFGVSLPLGSSWDSHKLSRYPCRFWGSVYDSSLIIGGSGSKGQFDVCASLDLGDRILITDMTGVQFSYEVARIDRRKHADMETFQEDQRDLILFARDGRSRSYMIVRCVIAPSQSIQGACEPG